MSATDNNTLTQNSSETPPPREKIALRADVPPGERARHDARNLIELAERINETRGLAVAPLDLVSRWDDEGADEKTALEREVAIQLKNPGGERRTGLDREGTQWVCRLLNSPEVGYEYAFELLRNAGIDPENLPEGSAPLWGSQQEALVELLGQITPEMLAVINQFYGRPAFVVEPVCAWQGILKKNIVQRLYGGFDRELFEVGGTQFEIDKLLLRQINRRRDIGFRQVGKKIIAWRYGIIDSGYKPKVLPSDGAIRQVYDDVFFFDSNTVRAKRFLEEGPGTLGFGALADSPLLCAMVVSLAKKQSPPAYLAQSMGVRITVRKNNSYFDEKATHLPRMGDVDRRGDAKMDFIEGFRSKKQPLIRPALMFEKTQENR